MPPEAKYIIRITSYNVCYTKLLRELGASHAQQDLYDQVMVVAAEQLSDMPRVRQLLKARLSTRVWDASSWDAFIRQSRLVDGIEDATAVRDA